jgi:hypothetical protein
MTTSTCTIPDCPAPARARGMCSKHYMRVRRHGDANAIHHPGRQADTQLTVARSQFPDRSPRTQARFARTLRFESSLRYLGEEGYLVKAITAATRRNGSLNFEKLEGLMEYRVAVALEEREQDLTNDRPPDPDPRIGCSSTATRRSDR